MPGFNLLTDAIKTADYWKSRRLARYDSNTLTELGKVKAEDYGGKGPEFDVMNDLNDNGPSTAREISERLHMEEKIARVVLDHLIMKQRVVRVNRGQ